MRHWFSVCGHDLPNNMMCVWNLTQGVDSKFLDQVRTGHVITVSVLRMIISERVHFTSLSPQKLYSLGGTLTHIVFVHEPDCDLNLGSLNCIGVLGALV